MLCYVNKTFNLFFFACLILISLQYKIRPRSYLCVALEIISTQINLFVIGFRLARVMFFGEKFWKKLIC